MKPVHIYFLGIGGIGMSALARYFHSKSYVVSGYDKTPSPLTDALEAEGMKVYFEEDAAQLEGVSQVIYTPAIKQHVVLDRAKAQGIPLLKRSQALGEICKAFRGVGIAGTHGKTTTSSMTAHLMRSAGIDASAFLGGISRNLNNSNFAIGSSDFVVMEADEFDRSFLTLFPEFAVITSVDADHLDIYGTDEEVKKTYKLFASQVQKTLLVPYSLRDFDWGRPVLTYGIEEGDFQIREVKTQGIHTTFSYHISGETGLANPPSLQKVDMHLPGRHNLLNMCAALSLTVLSAEGNYTGDFAEKLKAAVSAFSGIKRRFEILYDSPEISYIDDYAHHPTELAAAMQTVREYFPDRQFVVIFQPHLFTRTRDFHQGFGESLSVADEVLLLPIYPARELPIEGVSSEIIFEHISHAQKQIIEKSEIVAHLQAIVKRPAVVLTVGAGDIDREVEKIRAYLIGG